jgi:ribose/xylose/arabinose/galactoside ABC-type transport system permease subunit
MLAFTSIIVSVVMSKYGLIPSVISGLLFTTFLGFISGVLVSYTKMPPFIATLGMMGIVRALAMTVANAKPVPINNEIFALVGNATIFGIPFASFLFLAVSILLYQLLKRRRLGRYIYAVGSSEQCAILSGIKIKNVKLFVYTMSAFLTAVGAFIWCARLTSGSPIGGSGYEMRSIAAVAVGGADLFGGQGTVFGTFAGVFIFGVIGSIINFTQIPPFWQGAFNGIFILLAVIYSVVRRSRKTG